MLNYLNIIYSKKDHISNLELGIVNFLKVFWKFDTSLKQEVKLSLLLALSLISLTSSTTSASVDTYLFGNKVISVYNDKTVDFSPFYDISGIDFITNEKELALILNNIKNNKVGNANKNIFFYLDGKLPKWKKMIN